MGKYIKKFDTHSDYEDFIQTEDFILPNVSYCVDNVDVHYNPIFWAYELEPGHFVAGEILNNILYFYTPVASGNKWIFDSNGVVLEDRSLGIKLQDAMDAINERFNTSFIDEDDKDSDFTIDDNVPNWNTYKKITLPKILFAYEEESNKFIFGEFKGDTLRIQTQGNTNIVWLSSETGVINGTMTLTATPLEKILQAVNEKYGSSYENWSQLPTVYEVGDNVPNWNVYEKIELDPYNGHAYVDLGLPSGTLWATMNVGANSPTDYGLYFAWGETQGYNDASIKAFSWSDYKFNPSGDGSTMSKYNSTDGKTILDLEDDAARANWGGSWKTPTDTQFQELLDNTNKELTTINNINGYKFTNKTDSSKYIFIPAAGGAGDGEMFSVNEYFNVLSSSLYSSRDNFGRCLSFDRNGIYVGYDFRCYGHSVRAVINQ